MERRMKPLILLLMTALLCLTIEMNAMIRPKPKHSEEPSAHINVSANEPELYLENGLWGLRTRSGRVLLKPAWAYLRITDEDTLIARRRNEKLFGMIDSAGKTLLPFIYSDISSIGGERLWVAKLEEDDKVQYHFFRKDGVLWSNTAWDYYEYHGTTLMLTQGKNQFSADMRTAHCRMSAWHTEHRVGLHTLVMDLTEQQLLQAPSDNALQHLGDTAAKYLTYLFITPKEAPDPSLLSAEDSSSLTLSYHYRNCTLRSASVSRVKILESEGFPSYLVQMQVTYNRTNEDGSTERVRTSMSLTVSVNASGTYGYSAFFDPLIHADNAS